MDNRGQFQLSASCWSNHVAWIDISSKKIWAKTSKILSWLFLVSQPLVTYQPLVLHLTSSSDLMVRSCIISWKRSKLFVPMGCSSNSLHRATSWGRSRCSRVSSSSNSFENRTMSFVVGCSPVPRTWWDTEKPGWANILFQTRPSIHLEHLIWNNQIWSSKPSILPTFLLRLNSKLQHFRFDKLRDDLLPHSKTLPSLMLLSSKL